MATAKGWFEVTAWEETPWDEAGGAAGAEGSKLTEARVAQRFDGDLVGTGSVRWLMWYRPDGTARFVGLQQVEAQLDGRTGTFVLETAGDFAGGVARWQATVVPGSGAGGLAGLSGGGRFEAPQGSRAELVLDYDLGG